MIERDEPAVPASLGAAGAALWRAIHDDLALGWRLDAREVEVLIRACRCADEMQLLEAAADADGPTTIGSRGQIVVHPALTEARHLRLTQLRLLGTLELVDPADAPGRATPAAQRARRAAQSRWGNRRTGAGHG